MKKRTKLIPIKDIKLKAEKVRDVFFLDIYGGDKMFWIFESGKTLVMPVYRECPVQAGTVQELEGDFNEFLELLDIQKYKFITDRNNTIQKIKDIKNGMDSG